MHHTTDLHALSLKLRAGYFIVSAAGNLCSTSLICYRLIRMDTKMRKLFHDGPDSLERVNTVLYSRISMVLIDSALPFALFGVACAVISQVLALDQESPDKNANIAYNIIWPLWFTSCVRALLRVVFTRASTMLICFVGPRSAAHHLSDCDRKLKGSESDSWNETGDAHAGDTLR